MIKFKRTKTVLSYDTATEKLSDLVDVLHAGEDKLTIWAASSVLAGLFNVDKLQTIDDILKLRAMKLKRL